MINLACRGHTRKLLLIGTFQHWRIFKTFSRLKENWMEDGISTGKGNAGLHSCLYPSHIEVKTIRNRDHCVVGPTVLYQEQKNHHRVEEREFCIGKNC